MLLLCLVFLLHKVSQSSQSEQGRHSSPKMNLLFVLPMTLHRNLNPLSASLQPIGLCRGRSPQSCAQSSSLSSILSYFLMPRVFCSLTQSNFRTLLWQRKHVKVHKLASRLLRGCDLNQLIGMVAGHLMVCLRLKGPSQDPLNHISLLSSFLPSLGPFYFKDILPWAVFSLREKTFCKAELSHTAQEPNPQEAKRTTARRAVPGWWHSAEHWFPFHFYCLPHWIHTFPVMNGMVWHSAADQENKGHSQQRESHEWDFQRWPVLLPDTTECGLSSK